VAAAGRGAAARRAALKAAEALAEASPRAPHPVGPPK
jgi:hypothetical protein